MNGKMNEWMNLVDVHEFEALPVHLDLLLREALILAPENKERKIGWVILINAI